MDVFEGPSRLYLVAKVLASSTPLPEALEGTVVCPTGQKLICPTWLSRPHAEGAPEALSEFPTATGDNTEVPLVGWDVRVLTREDRTGLKFWS